MSMKFPLGDQIKRERERWVQRPESEILAMHLERLFSGFLDGAQENAWPMPLSATAQQRHWVSTTLDPFPATSTKGMRLKCPAFQAGSPGHNWDLHQRQGYALCSSPSWVRH